jgi:hypothetical protein
MRRLLKVFWLLSLTGLAMACTGMSITDTTLVGGAGFGIHLTSFIVDFIPCERELNEDRLREIAKAMVCEELQATGQGCE